MANCTEAQKWVDQDGKTSTDHPPAFPARRARLAISYPILATS